MNERRRGIRLKELGPGDPALERLRDAGLGAPAPGPREAATPPPAEVAREVLEVLEETLDLLAPEANAQAPPDASPLPATGAGPTPEDTPEDSPGDGPAAAERGADPANGAGAADEADRHRDQYDLFPGGS